MVLLGLPLLVIFSIFAAGVYGGATRADRVVELEQRWLGIAPPEGRLLEGAGAPEELEGEQPIGQEEPGPEEPAPSDRPPGPEDAREPEEPEEPAPSDPKPVTIAEVEPVGAELRARFEEPRVVRVKIMVDPALVVAREDWLSYVGDLFEATRASFDRLFGIDLELQGVVVWDAAVGATLDALLADLSCLHARDGLPCRGRDGADLLIGLLARARPSGFVPARWTENLTGDHALVFADVQQPDRFYRNLLRALAMLFGAEPTQDAAAKQLGSFMSDADLRAGVAPTLDPENRGKVIINKRRPIATPAPEPVEPDVGLGEDETI